MSKTRVALAGAALLLAVTVSGCSSATDTPQTAASAPPSRSAAVTPPAAAQPLLSRFGLAGMDAVAAIDHLDRLGGPARPRALMASVRPDELLLSSGDEQNRLDIPNDRFYLSVAPYVNTTHQCFNHSLTTCQGELTGQDVQVRITDASSGKVLVEGTRTTFENGFVGFWLPRHIQGTLRVTQANKTGQVDISTGQDDPTCLTTLRLT